MDKTAQHHSENGLSHSIHSGAANGTLNGSHGSSEAYAASATDVKPKSSRPRGQVPTKERLLEAAGEVFAEKGFRDATVRDICARAGANIAAVNYHFRDKESLYAATFEHVQQFEQEHYPLSDFESAGTPEERLVAFIRVMCLRLFDLGRPSWHIKLMTREMIEPTSVMDTIVVKSIKPKFEILANIVGENLGLPARNDITEMCAASVIGQVVHYHHCREVTKRLCSGWQEGSTFIDDLVTHVAWFSRRAIDGIRADVAAGRVPAMNPFGCNAAKNQATAGGQGG
jgi:AcrR family transcriptional regulator